MKRHSDYPNRHWLLSLGSPSSVVTSSNSMAAIAPLSLLRYSLSLSLYCVNCMSIAKPSKARQCNIWVWFGCLERQELCRNSYKSFCVSETFFPHFFHYPPCSSYSLWQVLSFVLSSFGFLIFLPRILTKGRGENKCWPKEAYFLWLIHIQPRILPITQGFSFLLGCGLSRNWIVG